MEFSKNWSHHFRDVWVLDTVGMGYAIEFQDTPPTRSPIPTPVPREPDKQSAMDQAIVELTNKKVVEPVLERQQGFYSTLFLVPKKSGGWRPVLNLKPLNHFVKHSGFRLDSIRSVRNGIREGDYATSLDLSDAYHHIAIRPDHRRFLRFVYKGNHWQFRALPFGLSSAPRAFCRVLAPVIAWCHKLGIRLMAYLDDWLLLNQDPVTLSQQTQQVHSMLTSLGWIISEKKSQCTPQRVFPFIGAVFDPTRNLVSASAARIAALSNLTSKWSSCHHATARDFMEVLGHLASLIDIVPFARLHMRGLQMCLLRQWRAKQEPLHKLIAVDERATQDLQWWSCPSNWQEGGPIWDPPTIHCIVTDASLKGWGAHWEDQTVSGVWSDQESAHINALEMRAVLLALQHWLPLLQNKRILIRSDNIATVQYINKQGGTISPRLCHLAVELWQLASQNGIWLVAAHIKGESNTIADSLSRGKTKIPWSEWSLCPLVTQQIFAIFGTPNIDLFASRHNHKLPTYCSWDLDPSSLARDSLSISWNNLWGYAYPPISLIPQVLRKVSLSTGKILLLAPWWPLRPWFPCLLELLVDVPALLPQKKNLLRLCPGTALYPDLESLKLTVWPISNNSSLREEFLNRLDKWSWPPGDPAQSESTKPSTEFSIAGATQSRKIPLRLM